jgi:hypothetical protein
VFRNYGDVFCPSHAAGRLLSIDPPGEQQEEGERRRQRVHGGSVPERLSRFKRSITLGVDWAEFLLHTPFFDCVDPANDRVIRRRRSFRTGREKR